MKHFSLLGVVVLLLLGFPLHAQSTWRCGNDGNVSPLTPTTTARSYFGKEHTPKGHLHILVVYVQFDDYGIYDSAYNVLPANWGYVDTLPPNDPMPASEQEMWAYNSLPTIAQHFPGYPAGQNRLFNADLPIGEKGQVHNVSEYYSLQSGGELQLTADIFQIPLRLSFSRIRVQANAEGTGKQGFYALANQAVWAQMNQIPAFTATYTPEKWQEVLVFYRVLSPLPDSLFETKPAPATLPPNADQLPITAIEGASGNWVETLRTLLLPPAPEGFWTAPAYYNLPLSTFIFQK